MEEHEVEVDVQEDVMFHMPLPPPGFPHHPGAMPLPPGGPHRMLFMRGEAPAPGERTHDDLMLRKVPRDAGRRFRAAAGARSMTHAEYLTALVELHEAMRALAPDDERVAAELARLRLESVTV